MPTTKWPLWLQTPGELAVPRLLTDEQRERKRAADRARYAKRKTERTPEEAAAQRAQCAERARKRRQTAPDAVRATKQRYYASAKGKACKRREDAARKARGLTAAYEARRAARGVSTARKAARQRWAKANPDYIAAKQALRRTKDRPATPFDAWVLREAQQLAKLRAKTVGGAWEVDHVVPVSLGGTSEATNLQVVPAIWNRTKSNRHTERFFGA